MVRERRFWLACAATLATLSLTTAVGASASRTPRPNSLSGTITFAAGSLSQRAYDVLIGNFERVHPQINVKATYIPANQFPALVDTQFQAGNAPDVVALVPGRLFAPSLLDLAHAGYLADLSSSPWAKRIPSFAKPLVTVGHKLYGWPLAVVLPSIIYNRQIFGQLGLTVPKTWAQFMNTCRTIKQRAPNVTPAVFGGATFASDGGLVAVFASSTVYAKDPTWNAKRLAHKATFQSTPGWRVAVQDMVDLKNNCFGPSVASDTPQTILPKMVTGQAAMLFGSDGQIANVRALNPQLDVGLALAPGPTRATTYMTLVATDGVAVNKKASNISAARAFVDFLARQKQNSLFATVQGEVAPSSPARQTSLAF